MNPNSDLKNENAMAANAESSTVCSGYAESRIQSMQPALPHTAMNN